MIPGIGSEKQVMGSDSYYCYMPLWICTRPFRENVYRWMCTILGPHKARTTKTFNNNRHNAGACKKSWRTGWTASRVSRMFLSSGAWRQPILCQKNKEQSERIFFICPHNNMSCYKKNITAAFSAYFPVTEMKEGRKIRYKRKGWK